MSETHVKKARGLGWGLLAILAAACSRSSSVPDENAGSALAIEHVSTELEAPLLLGVPESRLRFRVSNPTATPLSILGVNGRVPVCRVGVRSDNRAWVEREPTWVECGTGLYVGSMDPGVEVEVEVQLTTFKSN